LTIIQLKQKKINDDGKKSGANTGFAKVAVQCFGNTFVINQVLVLRINIRGKIAIFAKLQNVCDLN
jgi:hypothetical protein